MDNQSIAKPLKIFISNLKTQIKLDSVLVFGSHTSDQATSESDIDVVVVSNDFKKIDEENRFNIIYKASQFIIPDIHPWPATTQELKTASHFSILGKARRTGISISLT